MVLKTHQYKQFGQSQQTLSVYKWRSWGEFENIWHVCQRRVMGNTSCCNCRKRIKKYRTYITQRSCDIFTWNFLGSRNICLLLLGLDNAGKTVTVKNLAREPIDEVVPTVGFSVINLKYNGYKVKVYDLGGGPTIRGIWHRYFVDAHGIVFVIDSSDFSRLYEVKEVLSGVLSHEKISGKPVLILANKQDNDDAMDEVDLIETLQLEELVNLHQCPTLVETCSAAAVRTSSSIKLRPDPGIKRGYNWLMSCVVREYKQLNERVRRDVHEEEKEVQKSRADIIERLRVIKEAERQKQCHDAIELYSDYEHKNGKAVQPFDGTFSASSADSSRLSTPQVHRDDDFKENHVERPKSATQIIREQLQLHNVDKKRTFRLSRHNRTEPVYFCKTTAVASKSAHERRGATPINDVDRRMLRSAGDPVFTVSNHMGGGDLQQHLFQMKQVRYRAARGSAGDSAVSVVEVD